MFIYNIVLNSNPFINAYFNSDLFGKCIFIALVSASLISWSLILYKCWLTRKARKYSDNFQIIFEKHQLDPLTISAESPHEEINPFRELYFILKKQTLELLRKNRHFASALPAKENTAYLSSADISLVESHLAGGIAQQSQKLEAHLFVLAMIVTLGPFLGLLGTVWGILTSFGEMQSSAANNQAILGGISLALATTVLGILDAIPALIGYSYLKSSCKSLSTDMECFSNEMLAAIELHYRKVDMP